MSRFDLILKKSKEIKSFQISDVDSEWNNFLSVIGETEYREAEVIDLNHENRDTSETNQLIIYTLSLAASLILIFAVIFTFQKEKTDSATLTTASTGTELNLIDGTKVTLAPHTSLKYFTNLEDASQRTIYLNGDATFDISKNILPLRVYHNDIYVEVLGTEFAIKDNQGSVEIVNISGLVKVAEIKNTENFRILKKGDVFLFKNGIFTDPNVQVVEEKAKVIIPVKKKVNPVLPKAEPEKTVETPVVTTRKFKLDSVLKDYLIKYNKKKIKLEKGFKPRADIIVNIDKIDKPYIELLEDLQKQGFIVFRQGECPDCYIIGDPEKNK